MDRINIKGKNIISGKIKVSGAKNSVLPIMCASLLSKSEIKLTNVPNLNDVHVLKNIISSIGRISSFNGEELIFEKNPLLDLDYNIPDMAGDIRYSVLLLGALLATRKKVMLPLPGGCGFSDRPIDIHLDGLKQLGASITLNSDYLVAETTGLKGAEISLRFPSVGATENLLIASTFAEGTTILHNIAKEPEILDLINFLNKIGANISIIKPGSVQIVGVNSLDSEISIEHEIIPDRIEAATYMILGAIAADNQILVENIMVEHNLSFLNILQKIGVKFKIVDSRNIIVYRSANLVGVDITTDVYPALATDIQPMLAVLLTQANGESRIIDKIYPSRFQYAEYLQLMGADVNRKNEGGIIINGPTNFVGSRVWSTDLRGGAAVLLAGIIATGNTEIENSYQISRGYSDIVKKLSDIGVKFF